MTELPPEDTATAETDEAAQEALDALKAALTTTVLSRIKAAVDARQSSGIEEIWQDDADQYDGIDAMNPGSRGVKEQGQQAKTDTNARSKVFLNITKPKTDAAVARVQEMLVPHDDKPWEIEPTPIPEFVEAANSQDQTELTLADGTKAPAADVAKAAMAKARRASEKMGDWIEDQFVEGGVYSELRKVIRDAGRTGTGVLKGPFPVSRSVRKWDVKNGVAALIVEQKISPTSKRKDARDIFPDPSCGDDIHDGSYLVERDYATARQLKRLAKDPEYSASAIAEALREGPNARARDRNRFRNNPGETQLDSDVFELWHYYGEADPATLIAMGVSTETLSDDELQLASMPAIVTMLNDRPLKVVLNPLETGEFPFDVFVWDAIDGQWTGRGVPRKMGVAQRMLNASLRALLENAGLSSGAQIAFLKGAMEPMGSAYAIEGRKLWSFTPNEFCDDIRKAMNVWTIPSVQKDLAELVQFSLQMADELTNLPMLLQGQQGTAPELLGGMQMLMQNASAPLRVVAKQFDDMLIEPHLKRYYDFGMQSGPDEAKGDMQTKARGSTALIQREMAREFLIHLYSISKDEALRINPAKLGDAMAKSNGFSLASIQYSDEEWDQLQEAKKGQQPPQDPRVEAAHIRAQAVEKQIEAGAAEAAQRLKFEAEDRAAQRAVDKYIHEVELQVQILESSNRKDISLEELRGLLTTKVIDSRDRQKEMQLKLSPANPTNEGI